MRRGQWLRVVQIIPLRIFRGPDMPMVGEMQRAIKFDGHEPGTPIAKLIRKSFAERRRVK